jgi:hypothetical protein
MTGGGAVHAIVSGRERIELETLSHFPVKRISGFKSAGEICTAPTASMGVRHQGSRSAKAWRFCNASCAMISAAPAKPNRPVLSVTS